MSRRSIDKINKEVEKAKKRFENFDEEMFRNTNGRVLEIAEKRNAVHARFVKALNDIDKETVKDESRNALLTDANAISLSKDLKLQREKFATLSTNMFALAKTVKLSADPVYQQYCPMKKASWLSDNKAIKNPYYGSAMLTCGSVKQTL